MTKNTEIAVNQSIATMWLYAANWGVIWTDCVTEGYKN